MVFTKRKVGKEKNVFFSMSQFPLGFWDAVSLENCLKFEVCVQGGTGQGMDIY